MLGSVASMMRRISGRVLLGLSGTHTLPQASTASSMAMCPALLWAQMPTRLWGVGSMAVSAAASARTWAARASKRMGPSGASMAVRSGQRCAARQKKSIGYMG